MSSQNKLKDFYQSHIYPELKGLEKERKAIISKLKWTRRFLFLLAIILPVIAISVIQKPLLNMSSFLFDLFVLLPLYFILASKIKKPYHREFKSRVVTPVVQAMGKGVVYEPDSFVAEEVIRASHIFKIMDDYRGDDYVKGRFLGKNIEFSQVKASYNIDGEGHNEKIRVNLLHGWMFVIDIKTEVTDGFVLDNKDIKDVKGLLGGGALGGFAEGALKGLTGGALGTLAGGALGILDGDEELKGQTGDVAFDKKFELRGSKADILKFLTPEIRQILLEISSEANSKSIVLALRNKKLYFGVDSVINLEASVKRSLKDFEEPMQLMEHIKNAVTLAQGFEEEEEEMEMAW